MAKEDFKDKLEDFINKNKGRKITNSAVDQTIYDKVLERQQTHKRTNIKSITNVTKLCQYFLAAKMLNDRAIMESVREYIYDVTGVSTYRSDFEDMFSNVEIEFPDFKVVNNDHVVVENDKLIYRAGDTQQEIKLDNDVVLHKLLKYDPWLDLNAWKNFEYEIKAPIGSITIATTWQIEGTVKFDKNTGEYTASNISLLASYPVEDKNLICRYTGLNKSAWISVSQFARRSSNETIQNREWDGSPINRGTIYIAKGHDVIASVKGDWDGFYNNISFEKLRDLLDQLV